MRARTGQNTDAASKPQNQVLGLIGLLGLAVVTASEAGWALIRVSQGG
jgi:hypothetical protein